MIGSKQRLSGIRATSSDGSLSGGEDTTSGSDDTSAGEGEDLIDGGADDTTDDGTDTGGGETLAGGGITEDLDERDDPTLFDVISEEPEGAVLEALGTPALSSPVAGIDAGDLTVSIEDGQILVALGEDFSLLDRGHQASIVIPYTVRLPDGSARDTTLTVLVDGEEGTEGDDELILDEPGETIRGGAGDDLYIVDDDLDDPVEAPEDGLDTVRARIDWELGDNLENLELDGDADLSGSGNALANRLLGNAGRNTLAGLAGDDTLDGSLGADVLRGGLGNDTYFVDDTADLVEEDPEPVGMPRQLSLPREPDAGTGAGIDTVIAQVSFTLGANLENLQLTGRAGSEPLVGNGNAQDNALTGNDGDNALDGEGGRDLLDGGAGDDTLDGGSGNDTLAGGNGDDTYLVDATTDVVREVAGAGQDTVLASTSYTLPAHVENLRFTGDAARVGQGNAEANLLVGSTGNDRLTGRVGNDTLDGAAGQDVLQGGAGNDTYVVTAGDITTETTGAGAGTDTVQSAVDWTLAPHLENLELAGSAGARGTGNGLGNAITGSAGADLLRGLGGDDTLSGGVGDDVLAGGAGRDTLSGGDGADVFVFASPPLAGSVDRIGDFDPTADSLRLDRSAFPGLSAGELPASGFVSGPGVVALDAADRILYDTATGSLYYDADGSGEKAARLVAVLGDDGAHPDLDHTAFVIVS